MREDPIVAPESQRGMRASVLVCLLLTCWPGISRGGSAGDRRQELRAVWIATVANIDWPRKPGLTTSEQKRDFIHLLDELQALKFNAVFLQVRPCGDAFYPSRFAPWSAYLTGTQGKDPGYDPLAFMVAEAHRRKIQLHAWFNPYRVSMGARPGDLAPDHPARRHPDWVVTYGGKLYYDPGLPAVRELLISTIAEVAERYDIDGVHFDDYFYPYPVTGQRFPDSATFKKYGAAHFSQVGDWRRDNVNRLVSALRTRIRAIEPALQFGISPFGVWRNKAIDPTGSDTRASVTNYDDLYADTRTWIKKHWIDYIVPQLYWHIGFAPAAYEKLVPWWAAEVAGTDVHLFIGHATYRIDDWGKPDELPNQLALNRRYDAVRGSVFFRAKHLLENPLGFCDRLEREFYKDSAIPPR